MGIFSALTGIISEEKKQSIWDNVIKQVVLSKVTRPNMTEFPLYSPAFFETWGNELIVTAYVEIGNIFGTVERQDFRITLHSGNFKVKKCEFLIRGLISNKDKWRIR